jgi:excinuclease ABC subunit A
LRAIFVCVAFALRMTSSSHDSIVIRGCRVNNLKDVDVTIPKNKLVVITGLSGSGKSSLAFDTIYAEGQRRYVESLSSYARQFLELQDKPDVASLRGLSPTIAIEQRTTSTNPRSTVGTITEVYDYLRVIYARAGTPHCPKCEREVRQETPQQIAARVRVLIDDAPLAVLAPVVRSQKGTHKHAIEWAIKSGYKEGRIDGTFLPLEELRGLRRDKDIPTSIDIVIARYGQFDESPKLEEQVAKACDLTDGFVTIFREDTKADMSLSQRLTCVSCGITLPELEPRLFSFNSPHGACPDCTGLGSKLTVVPELVIPNPRLTLAQGAIKPWTRIAGNQQWYGKLLAAVAKSVGFSLDMAVEKLSKKAMQAVYYGTGDVEYAIDGRKEKFAGVIPNLEQRFRETDSDYVRKEIEEYMTEVRCPTCAGKRLRPEALAVRFAGTSISDAVGMPLDAMVVWAQNLAAQEAPAKVIEGKKAKKVAPAKPVVGAQLTANELQIASLPLREVAVRLGNLVEVGLGYLTLDRAGNTLSGGELQRVRLATQLGSELSGVIYVLDEPSIGLHPRDNDKLIGSLRRLRDLGNTVIVVEHDDAMMLAADWIIDMGPGAGTYGGKVVAEGSPKDIMRDPNSLTGKYLSGKLSIPLPKAWRKPGRRQLVVKGATAFNLKNVTARFPLGLLTCVAGVSGSGKSTLVLDVLSRALLRELYRAKDQPGEHKEIVGLKEVDKVISIDQSPIGRTPRSNPATYTGIFTLVRDLFTEVPEAKLKHYDAGKFSFNVKGGGRCEACSGEGLVRIEMQFLPDVYVECAECHGKRYNAEALEIHYKDKTIADVLAMTVDDAATFFADVPLIKDKLDVLVEVGLGYLRLGQSATTLSGGEAQRVKLATELSRRATGRTLYILDEPTTGLHVDDVKRLLGVLQLLVDKGNSVVVIEHNLDVIKCADWVIDMGPDGGDRGGRIVAEGTPRDVAKVKESSTGEYLREVLGKK